MKLTAEILSGKGVTVRELEPFGGETVARLFLAVVLGDWVSFYLALLNGADPTDIPEISYLKEQLSKNKKGRT